ncbi:MAG TPA: DUF1638 domain-containing protein [Actinomycetota bacterium]|nr:DUF1638 domain-containing protein [Actinomycetota bacterium]
MVGSERRPLAILACGALAREVREIAWSRGWDADLHTVPALHHLSPKRIPAEVDRRLQELEHRYERIVVVYGDCGTGGALDAVLETRGVERTPGPHCYEMLGGRATLEALRTRPGTFFLTDWLVRNWDRAVVEGLGVGRFPFLRGPYFDHVTHVRYLRRERDPALTERARAVAEFLGCPLEIVDVGLGELEGRLIGLVEGAAPTP